MNEQPLEKQPDQEAVDAATKSKIEFIWLNGKLNGNRAEIYSRMSDFFKRLREKYPKEKMEGYLLYHLMIKSNGVKAEDCHGSNGDLINEIIEFVDNLCRECGGEEKK